MSFYCLLASMDSDENSATNLAVDYIHMMNHFSLTSFETLVFNFDSFI